VALGQALSVESFDPAVFAALCSRDLTSAAGRLARYKPLIGPLRLHVDETTTTMSIRCEWPGPPSPPSGLVIAELIFWVALARLATRSDVRPVAARAPVLPEAVDAVTAYLGVPVERADEASITFSAEDASRRFLTANARLWDTFEPDLRRRLSELTVEASTGERVRSALLELLPAGEGTMQGVAGRLGVSTRTLQRRLKAEGTTFQELLGTVREGLARHYLATSRMPAAEISFLLGYGDPNSFYRAFHGWTGTTPERLRSGTPG